MLTEAEAIAIAREHAADHSIPWGCDPIRAELEDSYIPNDTEEIVYSPAWNIRTNADRLGGNFTATVVAETGEVIDARFCNR